VDYNAALLLTRGTTSFSQRLRSCAWLAAVYLLCVMPDYGGGGSIFSEFAAPALAAVLLLTAVVFFAPAALQTLSEAKRRKFIIAFSIVVNLGILAVFKYYGFFAESFAELYAGVFGSQPSFTTLNIVLPVGISFYTFQSMSYTIDVYRKDMDATDSFVEFAAYLSFFPQLVAGPIERGKNLLPPTTQIRRWGCPGPVDFKR